MRPRSPSRAPALADTSEALLIALPRRGSALRLLRFRGRRVVPGRCAFRRRRAFRARWLLRRLGLDVSDALVVLRTRADGSVVALVGRWFGHLVFPLIRDRRGSRRPRL